MAAQKGLEFLLKQGGTTVAGLQSTSFSINNEIVDVTTKDSLGVRTLLAQAGVTSLSISASGLFQDTALDETIRGYAFNGSANTFTLHFDNGDNISASFVIASYERGGEYNAPETFSITLEASGTITYTAAA